MLAKPYRLHARIRLKNAIPLKAPHFLLLIEKNSLGHNRYGFVVSKKVDKKAVVRNRLRRQLSACVEKQHAFLKPGFDILFLLKKEAVGKKTTDLCSIFTDLLRKKGYMS